MKKLNGQQFLLIIVFLISLKQGQGQNYFSQNTTSGLPTTAFEFDIADLENDGDLDVIISDFANVKIYTNDGSGNFTVLSGTAFSSVTYDYANAKFIDIDGDNDQDVLIVSSIYDGSSASQLYRNDGGNTFTLINSFPAVNMYNTSIAIGDLDNDTDNDIIITGIPTNSPSNMLYSPFLNDGSGNFSTTLSLTSQLWSNISDQFPIIGELNGDNVNDYIVTFNNNTHLAASYGGYVLPSTNSTLINQNAAIADFDGDGDNDVVGNLGESNYILFNDGSANFTQSSQVLSAGKGIGLIATGDVDNDGDIDILRKGQNAAGNGYVGGLYINDGKGYFYQNTSISIPDISAGRSMFVDLNGDNYPELFVSDQNTLTIYNNTFTTNHPDQALDLDGTNYYTANHDASFNTLPMTIEFWLHGANGASVGLMQKNSMTDGIQIGLIGGKLYVSYQGNTSGSFLFNQVYSVSDGNWHHIAIVIESTGAKLYGNGIEQGTVTWTGTPTAMTNTENFEIGRWTFNSDVFAGSLEEVRVWNTARTQAEIVDNMCGKISNPANNANLLAYYSMDDYITGNNLFLDESNNNNVMTISGGSLTLTTEQVGCTAPSLPVEFISFTGHLENKNAILKWMTATEENNHGFEIERSTDGLNWENIGFVQGNGTTTELSNYQFEDVNLRGFQNLLGLYYRLKQVDFDEKYEYSNIIQLETGNLSAEQAGSQQATVNIFPNPVSDVLNIEIQEPTTIQITNAVGQIIKEQTINASTALPVKDLTAGIYFIKINNQTQKIIKK